MNLSPPPPRTGISCERVEECVREPGMGWGGGGGVGRGGGGCT